VGPKADELTHVELDADQGLAGTAFQTGETGVSQDVGQEKAHLRELGERVGYVTSNMVTVALKSSEENKALGVMQVLNKREGAFDDNDVKLIETIAAQVAVAMESARLHENARLATVVRFIGDISHDVKNMVTPTVTGAQTLQMIADDCFEKFQQCLQHADREPDEAGEFGDAMSALRQIYPEIIEMILEGCNAVQQRMAEISAAVKGIVSEPHFEPSDIESIARCVGNMLDTQAKKKGVALTIQPSPDLPEATVDRKQVFNALYNLVFNAIDACSEGDSVALRLDCRPERTFPGGKCLLLECEDTGPGMPEHVKAKLFTDEAISTKPMGTGLGTRIVKNVIDVHEGTIEVESEVGSGTVVRCRVPVTRPSSDPVADL